MIPLTSTTRLLIVGLTGSGKTYWANVNLVRPAKRVALWDPYRKYSVGYFSSAKKVSQEALRWGVASDWDKRATYRADFEDFASVCKTRREPLIVIDEILLLDLLGCADPLIALVSQAQNWKATVAYLAQRAYSVPLTVRTQSSDVISGQQTDAHDIEALNRMTGRHIFELEKMSNLKQGEFIHAVVRR